MKTNVNTKRLVESGLLIALSVILSLFKPLNLPYGGGITICSMLPIIILAYRYGFKWGIFSGFTFGVLQLMLGFMDNTFAGLSIWVVLCVIVLDYLVAFSVLGLAGAFKKNLVLGCIVAISARFVVHFISGVLFFGSYADWFFNQEGFTLGKQIIESISGFTLSVVYSLMYNATYMIPELIITTVVAVILNKALKGKLFMDDVK